MKVKTTRIKGEVARKDNDVVTIKFGEGTLDIDINEVRQYLCELDTQIREVEKKLELDPTNADLLEDYDLLTFEFNTLMSDYFED